MCVRVFVLPVDIHQFTAVFHHLLWCLIWVAFFIDMFFLFVFAGNFFRAVVFGCLRAFYLNFIFHFGVSFFIPECNPVAYRVRYMEFSIKHYSV